MAWKLHFYRHDRCGVQRGVDEKCTRRRAVYALLGSFSRCATVNGPVNDRSRKPTLSVKVFDFNRGNGGGSLAKVWGKEEPKGHFD